MPIPEWALPIIAAAVPFALGVLMGGIVKTALYSLVALLAVLAAAPYLGYERLPKMDELVAMAREGFGLGRSMYGWLPLHSGAFVVGVAIGYWKVGELLKK